MTDQNTRFLIPELHVRGQIVKLGLSYQGALSNANYPSEVAQLLGQALAAVSAVGSIIKLRGSIIMQLQGDGPVHTLVAQANNAGEIRGLAHGYEEINTESGFTSLLGAGRLVLTIDGEGGRRYQGIVQIQGLHLSEVLEAYFQQSEQLRTHIHLSADDQQAACYLLQQLPGTENTDTEASWQHAKVISDTLSDSELLELGVEQILHRLFHQEDIRLFKPSPLVFRCRCSREKVIPAITQMGYEDAMQLVDEKGEIRANCEFCNRAHRFDRVEVASLFKAQQTAPTQRH